MYIQLQNVSKVIKNNTVLSDITFSLEGGKIYGFQGENGSGKTMLMRSICGLIKLSSGSIEINGKILGKDIDFPPSLGVLIESPGLMPNYTPLKI